MTVTSTDCVDYSKESVLLFFYFYNGSCVTTYMYVYVYTVKYDLLPVATKSNMLTIHQK